MTADLGRSELWDPETRRDPYAFYARVRASGRPVLQIDPWGNRLWVIARHADVLEGLQHPALGHEVHRHRRDGRHGPAHHVGEADRIEARQLISLDPPDHTPTARRQWSSSRAARSDAARGGTGS